MPKIKSGAPYQNIVVGDACVLVGECQNPVDPANVGCIVIISNRLDADGNGPILVLSPDGVAALRMGLNFVNGNRVYETIEGAGDARRADILDQFARLERGK